MRLYKFFLLVIVLIFFSCTGSKKFIYYTIESYNKVSIDKKIDKTIKIKKVEISRNLISDKIPIKLSTHKLVFYNRYIWASSIDLMLTEVIYNYFFDIGVFKSVFKYNDITPADYYLNTYINFLGEYIEDKKDYAYINMIFYLYDRDQNLIWVKKYEKKIPNTENSIDGIIKIINIEINNILRDLILTAPF